jgi:hypothetical protein
MGWVVSVTPQPHFAPGEMAPCTHCTGVWVDLRAGLDTEVRGKILCPCRGSNLDRPIVQSVVRHRTDWATPTPLTRATKVILLYAGFSALAKRSLVYILNSLRFYIEPTASPSVSNCFLKRGVAETNEDKICSSCRNNPGNIIRPSYVSKNWAQRCPKKICVFPTARYSEHGKYKKKRGSSLETNSLIFLYFKAGTGV